MPVNKEKLGEYETKLLDLYRGASTTWDRQQAQAEIRKTNKKRLNEVSGKGKYLSFGKLFNSDLGKKADQKKRIVRKLQDKIGLSDSNVRSLNSEWGGYCRKISDYRDLYLGAAKILGEGSYANEKLKEIESQYPIYGKSGSNSRHKGLERLSAIIGISSLLLSLFSFSGITGNVIGVGTGNLFGFVFILITLVMLYSIILLNKRRF